MAYREKCWQFGDRAVSIKVGRPSLPAYQRLHLALGAELSHTTIRYEPVGRKRMAVILKVDLVFGQVVVGYHYVTSG
jgi:hypothetical protein